MKQSRLVILLLFVTGVLAVLSVLFFPRKEQTPIEHVAPGPTLAPTPTTGTARALLQISSVFPPQGLVPLGGTGNSIAITFDREIDPDTAVVTAVPSLNIKPLVRRDNPNRLILLPRSDWKTNETYRLTLSRGLKSFDGQAELKEDVVLVYQTREPKPPVYDQPF